MFLHSYNDIISIENILVAWNNFVRGKRNKKDVQKFQQHLMDNILDIHKDLSNKKYRHGSYYKFRINDPKPREISKASVRDRLIHHLLYQSLCSYFDKKFIHNSYSCRLDKGSDRAIRQFARYGSKVSNNNSGQCWVLKCDIFRFFDSIDHKILVNILKRHIRDRDLFSLLTGIIHSFEVKPGTGLPLGNLTSQLLVNIYMNEFDQYVKHKLKVTHYIRYADDFVVLSEDRGYLERLLLEIKEFLNKELKLELHPKKVSIETLSSGVDFLGWVHFPYNRVMRMVTKRRMLRNLKDKYGKREVVQSYLGLLSHGNTIKLRKQVEDLDQKYSESDRGVKI